MNYQQNTNTSALIKENEWTVSNRLNFSTFTSCIGLTGYNSKRNGQLFGIHLVQIMDEPMNEADAKRVANLAAAHCEMGEVKIFGCIPFWEANPVYGSLKSALKKKGFAVIEVARPQMDGTYTVTFNTVTGNIDIVKK